MILFLHQLMDELSQGSDEVRSEVKDLANSFHITSGLLMTPFSSLQASFSSLLISRSGHRYRGCLAPTFPRTWSGTLFCIIAPIILALRKGSQKYNVLSELLIILLELTNNSWTVFEIRSYLLSQFRMMCRIGLNIVYCLFELRLVYTFWTTLCK